jgi:hypothetical protein
MSHLINDELIWISIPKCASISIETSLRNSKLKLDTYNPNVKFLHYHTSLNECFSKWGNKESVCITRDWFSKWISSLNFIWDRIELETNYTPIRKWEDIDNEFLYKTFDIDFVNVLHSMEFNNIGFKTCFLRLVKEKNPPIKNESGCVSTLISQKYYKSNKKCTHEFNISEINKFVDFIEDRFGERLILGKINQSTKRPNKIIVNDELKQWVWDTFEKRFEKKNILI